MEHRGQVGLRRTPARSAKSSRHQFQHRRRDGVAQRFIALPAHEFFDDEIGHAHHFIADAARDVTGQMDVGYFP